MDNKVVVFFGWVAGAGFVSFKGTVGNSEVVGVYVMFSFEFECGHGYSFEKVCKCILSQMNINIECVEIMDAEFLILYIFFWQAR